MKLHSELLQRLRHEVKTYEAKIMMYNDQIAKAKNIENLAVSFLIDNSGSMRGRKIVGVASWASIISNILSQADIFNEVLGFTARAWKGGRSREQWIRDGKPPRPGRLNDLRHIVYKSYDQSFQEADINFSLMLREGLLKENIDGEALLWAYSRIGRHPAKRKVLFVLSDGASVDNAVC